MVKIKAFYCDVVSGVNGQKARAATLIKVDRRADFGARPGYGKHYGERYRYGGNISLDVPSDS